MAIVTKSVLQTFFETGDYPTQSQFWDLLDTVILKDNADSVYSSIINHHANVVNPHNVTKEQVGLSAVDNTADADKPISTATATALASKADLVGGIIPSSQLPSYIDDVITVADFASLPATGESGKIYITQDTNLTYRWSGTAYVEISKSLALGETSSTAFRGDQGLAAYNAMHTHSNKSFLDTINQAIATTSSPTFATTKLTNLTDGCIPYETTNGLVDSIISQNANKIGINIIPTAASLQIGGIDELAIAYFHNNNNNAGANNGLVVEAGTNASDYTAEFRNNINSQSYLYIRGNGTIGIGTANPLYKLHISNNANEGFFDFTPTGIAIGSPTGTTSLYANGNEVIKLDLNGKVKIGSGVASEIFDVAGNINASGIYKVNGSEFHKVIVAPAAPSNPSKGDIWIQS